MSTKSECLCIVGVQLGVQIVAVMISKLENKEEHSRLIAFRAFTCHCHHLREYEGNCKTVGDVGVQGYVSSMVMLTNGTIYLQCF